MPKTDKRALGLLLATTSLGCALAAACGPSAPPAASPTAAAPSASAMWTHFVQGLRAKGGGALFCDSCHQGRQKLLARGDKKALAKFMEANYQDKLERADKKDHSCETCHSDPFEGKVFAKLWGIR